MLYRVYTLLAILIFSSSVLFAQKAKVSGIVTDEQGYALELSNVTVKGYPIGTLTNKNGYYELELSENTNYTIVYSRVTHKVFEQNVVLQPGESRKINVLLETKTEQLQEIEIEDKQVRRSPISRIDPKIITLIPDASGNFEGVLKTQIGVSQNNELSSQYSVRGGNFDENLIYVNDVQIYRPFLIRSGEQEGLSFVNSDLVSSVLFSAGGFETRYGDKMSSVLDIKYKKPTKFGASISGSLMGGAVMVQGASKDKKFSHISGFRYRSTELLLNSLEVGGEYDPRFLDFQTYLTYKTSDKTEVSFLGNVAQNSFTFYPQNRSTRYGTINESLQLNMRYKGKEYDKFNTITGASTFTYKPNDQLNLKLIGSGFVSNEMETYDVEVAYSINQVDSDLGSQTIGDSIANLGQGDFINHARNYLYATIVAAEHKGNYYSGFQNWQWGVKVQNERIEDRLNEWKMTDSAGYALPYTDSIVSMRYRAKANNEINTLRYNAYLQNTLNYDINGTELNITVGARAAYWDFNEEFLVSPRANIALKPNWDHDFLFRFSTGIYYQPAFYKEMRNRVGALNNEIKSQKSVHFVLGSDYNFRAWNRPFKLVTEAYYKHLTDLIYYQVENVRIVYSGKNDSDGYAFGIDMKVNGEFVKGVDSWLSLSVMRTVEDVRGDSRERTDTNGNVYTEYPGYMPRPSDQRVNLGIFFQDYFPRNPDYKMQLQLNFGTGLPFNQPSHMWRYDEVRTKAYQRVDIGFSKVLKRPSKTYPKGHFLHHVSDAWVSFEVFNLLDRSNTISHEWVTDYQGREYGVENSLTTRRINLKLTVKL